ncbi:hypothetical protein GCM10009422_25920 [Brevundimonas kwangchunensis]|uniref:BapA prefix-like domain-containing protein n=1 Tax=Brevundimonas kwangchunensis TaxID=322163 RepID=A0ABN1H387_9CAUL
MQDVVTPEELRVEAKLVSIENGEPREVPTVEANGVLGVRNAREVYLNLQEADVDSMHREGADLIIVTKDGEVLRLEGFYEGEAPRKLFLETADNRIALVETDHVAYDGPLRFILSHLAELSPFVILAAEEAIAGGAGGAASAGLIAGGVALTGGLLAGGGGGGDTEDGEPVNPPADTTPPAPATNLTFNPAGSQLSGSGEAGATVTVRNAAGVVIGTGTVAANGTFTITLAPPLTDGEQVSVTLTDAAGNTSTAANATAPDTTPPAAATGVDVSDDGATVTGNGAPGSTVTVRGPDGSVIGTGTVGADGSFTIQIAPPLTNGETVTVILTDPAGNPSAPTTAVAPDTTPPASATDVDVSDDGAIVTGRGEPGANVTVRGPDGSVVGNGTVGADGAFNIQVAPPLTNGETVSVVLTDAAGNPSTPATAIAPDLTAPAAPTGVDVSEDGSVLTGTGEAGATVTVRAPDGTVLGTAVVGADGDFSVTLSPAAVGGEVLTVVQADGAGNESPPANATAPDLTFPGGPDGTDAPVLIIGEAAGGVNAAELADGIQSRVLLTAGTQAGDRVTLTITSSGGTTTIEHTVTAAEASVGVSEIVLPSTLADGSYSVVAVIDDGRGATSAPSAAVAVVIDTSTAVPTITSANGIGLSGTAEAGATITLLDGAGNPVAGAGGAAVTVTADASGIWTIPAGAVPGGLDGFSGQVRATDGAGNTATAPVPPIDGSTETPVVTAANGSGLQGTAEAGATVEILGPGGAPLLDGAGNPVVVTADANGVWTVPAGSFPTGIDGFTGTVRATDGAGNSATAPVGPVDGALTISVNVNDVTADNIINIAEAGAASIAVSGTAFGDIGVGGSVTVTLSNGATQVATIAADGSWTVNFAGADLAASTTVSVTLTVTDGVGNTSTATDTHTFGIDLTPPAAPVITGANGTAISGTGVPGASIILSDNGGTVIATVEVGANGRWTVPAASVPGGLNGFVGSVATADPAGNTAATPVGPVDGLVAAPVITNANGAGLSGTAEAGATLTLLNGDGTPVLGFNGQPVTATAAADGTWTIDAGLVSGGIDGFTGSVRATDVAGNTATAPVGPVDGGTPAPVVTGANAGGISGTAEPGAVILLDQNGQPVIGTDGQPVSVQVAADGTWSIPASAVPGGLDGFVGSVRAVDPAGNSSATSVGPIDGSVSLTLTVDSVTADNVLNLAESQGTVTLSGRAVGDFSAGQAITVTLSNGAVLNTTLAADGTWTVAANGADLAASTSITASTTTTDGAGNSVTVEGDRSYTIDLVGQAPVISVASGAVISGNAEPGVTVELLGAGGNVISTTTAAFDGSFSFAASAVPGGLDGFAGSVRATDPAGNPASASVGPIDGSTTAPVITAANGLGLSGTAEAGATLTLLGSNGSPVLDGNGNPIRVTADASGGWSISGSALPGGIDGFTGSVRAVDQAGNSAATTVGPIDGSTPAPVITAANGTGLQGTAEANATVTILDASGQPVVDGAGNPITVTADANGVWTVPSAAFTAGIDGFIGSARATDVAGNMASTNFGPVEGDLNVSVNVNAVTADNVINIAEAAAGAIAVSGTAFGDYAGATVTITLSNGATQTVAVAVDGTWTANFAGADLAASTSVGVSLTVTDGAGNTTSVTDTHAFAVDLTPPPAPVITGANGLGLTGTGTAGATITLTGPSGAITSVTVGSNGVWTVPASSVPGGLNNFIGSVSEADPAGNTASSPVGPVDGVTVAPLVTASNGVAITGTAEAGATIALLTSGGAPVLGAGGVAITTVADGNGVWTIPASAIPGGSNTFTGQVRATDAAGNTALGPVGPVDGVTPAPLITAANGAGLSGTAEAGATLALLDGAGNPVIGTGGTAITVTVDAAGNWSIPASLFVGGIDGFTGQLRATDGAGNTATTAVGPIDGDISLTLIVNPITADNVINGAEAAQASVTVTGRAVGEFTAGQSITVTLSTGQTQTATLAADGTWSASFAGSALAGSTSVTASATVTDGAGNTTTVTDVQGYTVDLSTIAPVISIANGAGLSGTAEAGARITVRNASGQIVGSATADAAGAWSIPAAGLSANLNGFTGSVQATDAAGNINASPIGPVDGAISLSISVAPVTPDNVINIAESGGTVTVSGQATGEYRVGDTLTLTLSNGAVYSVVLAAGGAWSIPVSGADLAASTGLMASITTTDAAGNTATITANANYGVDLSAPPAPTLISAGATGLSGSGEAGATVQLLNASGVPITGANGQPITATVGAGGTWTIPASAFVGGAVPSGFTGQLVAADAAGNVSAATTVPVIDLTPPDGSTTAVTINVIAGDDIVNLAESQGPVTISGQVTGEFRAGDAVRIVSDGQTFTGTVAANGSWSIPVTGAALIGGTLQVTVSASDAAGNVGAILATRPYTLDIAGPGGPGGTQAPVLTIAAAADGLISPSELAAGVSANVALTPSAVAGDTLTLTITRGGVPQTFTTVLTAANITAGSVSFNIGSTLVDGAYTAVAVIRDPSGNVSAPSTTLAFAVDAVPINIGNGTAALSEATVGAEFVGTIPVTGATGATTFALTAPNVALTSKGVAVTWSVGSDGALVGSAGGRTVVRATIDANGQYRITLLDSLDHPGAGADVLSIPIGVSVTDSDGTAAGVITVGVTDMVPQLAAPVVLNPTTPQTIVGDLVTSMGPDGGGLVSVTINGQTFTYNPTTDRVSVTGSASSIVSYAMDDGLLTATTVRGETVTVDFDTGDYRIALTGQPASVQTSVRPDVAMGGNAGLLGLLNADVLGLIRLDRQQFFTASDINNDIGQVVVRYSAAIGLGLKTFSYNTALAAELGLSVSQSNTFLLPGSSQLTITALGGGAIDNLKLNEFLASISISGGLSGLLDLNVAQTMSITATDLAGHVTTASESNLANLSLVSGLLGSSQISQIVTGTGASNTVSAPDTGVGAPVDYRLYGYGGDDIVNGGRGNDILRGGSGNDTMNGGAGNDLIVGGTGNDTLTGGAGIDVFRWERGDQGTVAVPAADVITDFNTASVALGGDVLDLSSLLVGEGRIGNNPGNLANYIHFQQTADGTLVHISTTGGFVGGYGSATSATADQTILLRGVNLTAGFASDQAILTDLLTRGKLVVDTLSVNGSAAPGNVTIVGNATDGDGDSASTSVTVNTGGVSSTPPVAGNVAPVVQADAQNLLGLIGLGALGLNLNSQDLLVADANNNLSRVELEYAPLVALNLTPLTFAYSQALATAYGLNVQVTNSSGLLGIVAPSARITITSLTGGTLDNTQINRFLESIYLADTGGTLLSSSLLSVNLLNAMTLTATDNLGLSSSAVIGTVLNANALNSLDGPDPVGPTAFGDAVQVAADEGVVVPASTESDLRIGFGVEDTIQVPELDPGAMDAGLHADDILVATQPAGDPELVMIDELASDDQVASIGDIAMEQVVFESDEIESLPDQVDTLNVPVLEISPTEPIHVRLDRLDDDMSTALA